MIVERVFGQTIWNNFIISVLELTFMNYNAIKSHDILVEKIIVRWIIPSINLEVVQGNQFGHKAKNSLSCASSRYFSNLLVENDAINDKLELSSN